ncbi:Protein of unknown function [Thermomonospora echinospora]|uniref:GmrSD restriction endonucleases C-terminal domain-containing protein n=1 Tax=Thermomonospora echinospora TaxID=1992 RepID=A0A1H5T1V5_9ACTN|nr:HNH endonuclease family protein [Thermomonospora echinospora]SEF56148.1 Protein of unknown function [Thermomonospora echinospora]
MRRPVLVALTTILTALTAPPATAAPPPPPEAVTALEHLVALRTEAEGSGAGYSRELFPHWITISGTCNTRETVLKRDGVNVVTNKGCAAVSGSWYSPYDGATWYAASDIDIDHMVPLYEAWQSGADTWTTERRRRFANDLESSQLWAVTDNVNQQKSDKDPATWKPPLESFHCTYARSWIDVKWRYDLSADIAEKAALTTMLATC